MTLIEVFVVLAVLSLIFLALIPNLLSAKHKAQRIQCVSYHKQIGLGLRMWSNDYEDRFPWQVSTNAVGSNSPGTMELVAMMTPAVHFQIASNEIGSPTVLTCPTDKERKATTSWYQLTRSNVSYFVNLEANETKPASILIGDHNLMVNNKPVAPGLSIVTTNDNLAWDGKMHNQCGNVGLADGSVRQLSITNLNSQLQSSGVATNRFVIP
ncbi:MAG: type II secretion system protein [Verrucomicrobiota bacterium]